MLFSSDGSTVGGPPLSGQQAPNPTTASQPNPKTAASAATGPVGPVAVDLPHRLRRLRMCSHLSLFIYMLYIGLEFLLFSAHATGTMGSRAGGAQDAPEDASPQDSPIVVADGDRIPAPDTTTTTEVTTSSVMNEAATGEPTASTGPAASAPSSPPQMAAATASAGNDDNIIEEPEVIMGQPDLRAPGAFSLPEVMGTIHFTLNQMHDVLRQERDDINEERLHIWAWVSLLKKQMTSEKEKANGRQKRLDVMEILFARRQAGADKLDAQAQKLLNDAKELYAIVEARDNATIKQQDDLNA
jgi:hypothetical protein